jgi:AI-2E family transporter
VTNEFRGANINGLRSFVRFIARENLARGSEPGRAYGGFERKVDSEHADIDAVLNMAPTDQETEIVPPAEEPEEMPLPSDPKVIFLGGLLVLALLATAYVASEIVLPLVFAIILKLLLQPAMRILERLHVPRILAALLLILALFGTIVGLGTAISGPAGTWAAKLPEGIPRLQERLSFMREPINTLQRFCSRWKISEKRDRHQMPPRREAQLF